jgi:uncharacterized protein (UPF0548 family)
MQTFRRAKAALDDVSAASQQVVQTTQDASVALMVVTAISLVALLYACIALGRTNASA